MKPWHKEWQTAAALRHTAMESLPGLLIFRSLTVPDYQLPAYKDDSDVSNGQEKKKADPQCQPCSPP
jgi:hypothetical protein